MVKSGDVLGLKIILKHTFSLDDQEINEVIDMIMTMRKKKDRILLDNTKRDYLREGYIPKLLEGE